MKKQHHPTDSAPRNSFHQRRVAYARRHPAEPEPRSPYYSRKDPFHMATGITKDLKRASAYYADPGNLCIVGLDTPHKKGEHPLWDKRAFLPADDSMVASILAHGVKKPVFVRINGDVLEVVDGRRRIINARAANAKIREMNEEAGTERPFIEVPVILQKGTEAHLFGLARLLNRGQLEEDPLTTAEAAQKLIDQGQTEEQVATYLQIGAPMLKIYLSLLDLHPTVRKAVEDQRISMTAASKLAPLAREEQVEAFEKLLAEGGGEVTVKAAAAVRAQKTAEKQGKEGGTVAPPKKVIRKVVEKLEAGEIETSDISDDFLLGAKWAAGMIDTKRVKGLSAVVRKATEKKAKKSADAEAAE